MRWFRRRKRKSYVDLTPDQVFVDAQNFTNSNNQQMEGTFEQPISQWAVTFVLVVFLLGGAMILYKMAKLQIVNGAEYFETSENNRLTSRPIFSSRGLIYDRNGIELAWNDSAADTSEYPLRRYISAPGFGFLGFVRYPEKDKKGFYWRTSTDGAGAGIEEIVNEQLTGKIGSKVVEVSALGEVQSENMIIQPSDGDNISITIDSVVQSELYRAIGNHAAEYDYKGGSAVIMDIDTGEVIALASFPDVDPNILSNSNDRAEISRYATDPQKPFLNRVISGLYVPGSIVKPFMGFEALRRGVITSRTRIQSIGYIEVPNLYNPEISYRYRDWREGGHGNVTIYEAIADSVNTFFYSIGGGYKNQRGIGTDGIIQVTNDFGIGTVTGIELAGEVAGVVPTPEWKKEVFNESWRLGDTYITSIGQFGYQVTPLQIARSIAALANGGKLVKPHVLGVGKTEVSSLAYNKEDTVHAKTVMKAMRQTVTGGTAGALNIKAVDIAAKTGTAQVGYNRQYINSWIVGFYPYDDPKYSFAMVMEEGDKEESLAASWAMRDFLQSLEKKNHPMVSSGTDIDIVQ